MIETLMVIFFGISIMSGIAGEFTKEKALTRISLIILFITTIYFMCEMVYYKSEMLYLRLYMMSNY